MKKLATFIFTTALIATGCAGLSELEKKEEKRVVIEQYSDFVCQYCAIGNSVMKGLKKKYGDKLKVKYRHLPLEFHKKSMILAKYYEAIKMQDEKKAILFKDQIYENQNRIARGEKYYIKLASNLGVDVKRLKKDLSDPRVEEIIARDLNLAKELNFKGTPSFTLNGEKIVGAYPSEHFQEKIDKVLKENM